LCTLLRESLLLWQVEARLVAGERPLLAVIESAYAGQLSVQQAAPADEPVRWWLCWHAQREADLDPGSIAVHPIVSAQSMDASALRALAVDAPEAGPGAAARRRPCASTLGLLRSLRAALGVSGGARVRIAAGLRSEGAA